FDAVLTYARNLVDQSSNLGQHQQRVSWWAALALLRATISSPDAAAAALRTKATGITRREDDGVIEGDVEAINEQGERAVLDVDVEDSGEVDDVVPGADISDLHFSERDRRKLRDLISQAESLAGKRDPKLQMAGDELEGLLKDGHRPIVFCRYIKTAEYLAAHLGKRFKDVTVEAVTGSLPPEERKQRVADLGQQPKRILVATDCLSEGINLQEHFDAVMHYDLAWNPTRHEQREGRVDRFGQERAEIRTIMFYGEDNPVDRAVMDVLLRKAETIRKRLGVAVSVPQRSGAIMDTVFQAIFHGRGASHQLQLSLDPAADAQLKHQEAQLDAEWDAIEQRERQWQAVNESRSVTIFSQERIHPEQVKQELDEVRASLGSPAVVEQFVRAITNRLGYPLVAQGKKQLLPLNGMPSRLKSVFPDRASLKPVPVDFSFPVPEGVYHLSRTSEAVEAMATIAIDGALDEKLDVRPAKRTSAIRTNAVKIETTLAVVRLRVHLRTAGRTGRKEMLAEESMLVAWRWTDEDTVELLPESELQMLLEAEATALISDQHPQRSIERVLGDEAQWRPLLDDKARRRAREVLAAHRRVRDIASITGAGQLQADPMLPVDVLGLFVFLPA
ncbi:MAG: helicase-related protein, partial [Thermomicrobiales bacterium]